MRKGPNPGQFSGRFATSPEQQKFDLRLKPTGQNICQNRVPVTYNFSHDPAETYVDSGGQFLPAQEAPAGGSGRRVGAHPPP
jgi:hypothetical protein